MLLCLETWIKADLILILLGNFPFSNNLWPENLENLESSGILILNTRSKPKLVLSYLCIRISYNDVLQAVDYN